MREVSGQQAARFCPRCGARRHHLKVLEATTADGWPTSADAAEIIDCGECGCTTRVTPSQQDDDRDVEEWTPSSDQVESALTDIRYNAQQLSEQGHPEIGTTLQQLADKIDRNHRVISNDRRETIYEATNRILEHAPGAEVDDGEAGESFQEVEEQVDTILSTIGVPDRIIQQ